MKYIKILVPILGVLLILFIFYNKPQAHCSKPRIFKNFITDEERAYILRMSVNSFVPSAVVDSSGVFNTANQYRVSETSWLPKYDSVIKGIYERAIGKIRNNFEFDVAEDLQVTKYTAGGFYKAHYDSFCDENSAKLVDERGQRKGTLIIYLTEDYEGGSIEFPNIKSVYNPSELDAIYFNTLDKDGECCEESLYADMEVTSGEKIICTIWFH